MIYLPFNDVNDYACYSIRNGEVIRAYKQQPSYNSTVYYDDYYINSHYFKVSSEQSFSNYSTLPICQSKEEMTNLVAYRNDFAEILVIFFLLVGGVWFLISKLVKTLLKGRKRY